VATTLIAACMPADRTTPPTPDRGSDVGFVPPSDVVQDPRPDVPDTSRPELHQPDPPDAAPVADDPGPPEVTPPLTRVLVVGAEEVAGPTKGVSRPSIALDSQGQPHIVADRGNPEVWIYHRLAGAWSEGLFAKKSPQTDAGRVYLPHLEIDAQDRGWVSAWLGIKESGTMQGQAVWTIADIATAPQPTLLGLANKGTKNGNLALDPFDPGAAVVMAKEGRWDRFDAGGGPTETGKLPLGKSGEKLRFAIRAQPGQAGVWHAVMSGYSKESSKYVNSIMAANVQWASHAAYPEMGEDMRHPGLGLDGVDPLVAYMAIAYGPGVVFNIWDGAALVFDPGALPVLEPKPAGHGNGGERFGPQWAPAAAGGAFVCWTRKGGLVLLAHVDAAGTVGQAIEIGSGSSCDLTADPAGHLHLAYARDGMRYRKIQVTWAP